MLSRRFLAPSVVRCCSLRTLSTTVNRLGIKSRKPWDQRFPVRASDVGPDKEGGCIEMEQALPEQLVAPTGMVHKVTGEYIHVPEMVPEFVVPDLTGFQLKPYVSYMAKEITQSELTAKDVFNSVYAADIEEAFRDGKIQVDNGKVTLQDGRTLRLDDLDNEKVDEIKST